MTQITAAETPLSLVDSFRQKYNFPDTYSAMAEAKETLEEASPECLCDWCKMPIAVPLNLLAENGYSPVAATRDAASLAACYLWRQYKIVYDFAEPLADELARQAFDVSALDVLPVRFLIQNMPYPCLYFRAHTIAPNAAGAFVWIERDTKTFQAELRVGIVSSGMDSIFNVCLHLVDGGTLEDCIRSTVEYTEQNADKCSEIERRIAAKDVLKDAENLQAVPTVSILVVLQMLLYIESANAEIEDNPAQKQVYRQPQNVASIKDKFREVRQMEVGVRISRAITAARTSPRSKGPGHGKTGSPKVSHMRRGHWHSYWVGKKDAERKLILKWIAPTIIHPEEAGAGTAQIIPIRGSQNKKE